MSTDIARTPIRWDINDPTAWLADMRGETQRHRDALTAQWPSDMHIGYMPNSGVVHMVPADEPFTSWPGVVALCGTTFHGLVRQERVEAKPCTLCTTAYNNGATTGIKPDPFPLGAEVQFDALIGATTHTITGTVVPRESGTDFKNYRRIQIRDGLHSEVRVENLTAVQ
jgi:hypothetical protein